MRRRYVVVGLALLLMGVNMLLLYIDDEKVDRISYIHDWTFAQQQDMYEKLHTEGVLNFSDEADIYFDQDKGEFKEFLIQEGDVIKSGDPIYSYKIHDYQDTLSMFQNEQEELADSITGIESAIKKMESYQIPQKITEYTFTEEMKDDTKGSTKSLEVPDNAVEAELMKEQYITEKEKELTEKKARQETVQSQIEDLASGDDTVTVESTYDGKVTRLSKSLDNPLMTIQPPDLHVEGELTEHERKQVTADMPVDIDIDNERGRLEGRIHDVSEYPEHASIQGESVYPFHVSMDDEDDEDSDDANEKNDDENNSNNEEDKDNETGKDNKDNKTDEAEMLAGYHATLAIQLEESMDATVLDRPLTTKNTVWKMTASGQLLKQPIKKGIESGNKTEITQGINPGDWIAKHPSEQFRWEAAFITPLKWDKLKYPDVFKSKQWKKGFLAGFLMH